MSKQRSNKRSANKVSREWADIISIKNCNNWNDEKVLESIVKNALRNKPTYDKPSAIITLGYPGSGKSTMIDTLLGDEVDEYVRIDIDSVVTQLPPFRDNLSIPIKSSSLKKLKRTVGSTIVFNNCLKIGRRLVNKIFDQAFNSRNNILYDLPQINFNDYSRLKLSGYNIVFLYATRPDNEYPKVLKNRAIKTGRFTFGTEIPTLHEIKKGKQWYVYKIALIARVFSKHFYVCYNSPKMTVPRGLTKKVEKLKISQPRSQRRANYYKLDPSEFNIHQMMQVLI